MRIRRLPKVMSRSPDNLPEPASAAPAQAGPPVFCPGCNRASGNWSDGCRYAIKLCTECEARVRLEQITFGGVV